MVRKWRQMADRRLPLCATIPTNGGHTVRGARSFPGRVAGGEGLSVPLPGPPAARRGPMWSVFGMVQFVNR